MNDPRLNKMAQVIINYSIELKAGQNVYVWGSTAAAAPLMLEVYREALKAGGNAFLRADLPGAQEIFLATAQGAQLDWVSPVDRVSVEEGQFDAYVRISAEVNTRHLSNADPDKLTRHQIAMGPILRKRMDRSAEGNYRWCVTRYPTEAHAMDAEMSLDEYTEFVFAAALLNDPDPVASWLAMGKRQQGYVDFLRGKKHIALNGPNINMTMRIDGRVFKNSQGLRNFPDGEIFTGPVEDSVNGWVNFTYPAIYNGREVDGVGLKFENGKVVEATAVKNQAFLNKVLDTDEGARRLGEFAIGTNYGITKFSRDILFDEKIGGTIHMACGNGYPDTGALNKSAVHWDMIAGMQQGEISADGIVFYRDGKFLI